MRLFDFILLDYVSFLRLKHLIDSCKHLTFNYKEVGKINSSISIELIFKFNLFLSSLYPYTLINLLNINMIRTVKKKEEDLSIITIFIIIILMMMIESEYCLLLFILLSSI